MRIAFVSANQERLPDPVIPLGVLAVMGVTPDHHDKHLWDLCFEDAPLQALATRLDEQPPELIALGLRNIQNADYTNIHENLDYYRELMVVIRAHSDAPVVVGGAGFSVMPRDLMETLRPDYGVSGEGEGAFPALLALLEQARPSVDALRKIPNLHFFDEHGVLHSAPPGATWLDLQSLPIPDRSPVDPRYFALHGTESVQTKRGCPMRCEYCTYPIIEGRRHRVRAPAQVADEMAQAKAAHPDVSHFFIVDSVFTLPPRHAKAVCRELIERGWDTPWTCYANPLGFDAELASLMAGAGCVGVEVGTDSGDDAVLKQQRKGFTVADVRRMHHLLQDVGIKDCHTFVLGTSGETIEQVGRTLDFIEDLDPYATILMIWMDELEAMDPALAAQRRALREQIAALLRERCPAHPHWIAPQVKIHFDTRLFRALRRRGLRGPLWQHIRR